MLGWNWWSWACSSLEVAWFWSTPESCEILATPESREILATPESCEFRLVSGAFRYCMGAGCVGIGIGVYLQWVGQCGVLGLGACSGIPQLRVGAHGRVLEKSANREMGWVAVGHFSVFPY